MAADKHARHNSSSNNNNNKKNNKNNNNVPISRAGALVLAVLVLVVVAACTWSPSTGRWWRPDSPSRLKNPRCLGLWDRKMKKHAELVKSRRETISESPVFVEREVYDPFEPTYTCHSEYRRGKLLGDGGKFVCGESDYFRSRGTQSCLVYSIGSNGDATFERAIAHDFGCEVHTFDPTGNSTKFKHDVEQAGGSFHAIGVGGARSTMPNAVTGVDAQILPVQDIVAMLGHAGRHIDIFKIDCEGCEYDAFATLWPLIKANSITIGQIQIELHGLDFAKVRAFFQGADEAGYMVFHKERNHWGCQGYICLEFSLIHVAEAQRIYQHTHC